MNMRLAFVKLEIAFAIYAIQELQSGFRKEIEETVTELLTEGFDREMVDFLTELIAFCRKWGIVEEDEFSETEKFLKIMLGS